MKESVTKEMAEQQKLEKESLEEDDPWMKSRFNNAQATTETPTEPTPDQVEVNTTDNGNNTTTEAPIEKTI